MRYVIEVDKQITSCYGCPCANLEQDKCNLALRSLKFIDGIVVKPEWCPLHAYEEGAKGE